MFSTQMTHNNFPPAQPAPQDAGQASWAHDASSPQYTAAEALSDLLRRQKEMLDDIQSKLNAQQAHNFVQPAYNPAGANVAYAPAPTVPEARQTEIFGWQTPAYLGAYMPQVVPQQNSYGNPPAVQANVCEHTAIPQLGQFSYAPYASQPVMQTPFEQQAAEEPFLPPQEQFGQMAGSEAAPAAVPTAVPAAYGTESTITERQLKALSRKHLLTMIFDLQEKLIRLTAESEKMFIAYQAGIAEGRNQVPR
jgi:hypothetical protein